MNINDLRNIVIQGQIATLETQIQIWKIYANRTDENVNSIISEIEQQITYLENMII